MPASDASNDLAGVLDLLVSMGTKATMAGTNELGAFLGGTLFFFGIVGVVRHHEA